MQGWHPAEVLPEVPQPPASLAQALGFQVLRAEPQGMGPSFKAYKPAIGPKGSQQDLHWVSLRIVPESCQADPLCPFKLALGVPGSPCVAEDTGAGRRCRARPLGQKTAPGHRAGSSGPAGVGTAPETRPPLPWDRPLSPSTMSCSCPRDGLAPP